MVVNQTYQKSNNKKTKQKKTYNNDGSLHLPLKHLQRSSAYRTGSVLPQNTNSHTETMNKFTPCWPLTHKGDIDI